MGRVRFLGTDLTVLTREELEKAHEAVLTAMDNFDFDHDEEGMNVCGLLYKLVSNTKREKDKGIEGVDAVR